MVTSTPNLRPSTRDLIWCVRATEVLSGFGWASGKKIASLTKIFLPDKKHKSTEQVVSALRDDVDKRVRKFEGYYQTLPDGRKTIDRPALDRLSVNLCRRSVIDAIIVCVAALLVLFFSWGWFAWDGTSDNLSLVQRIRFTPPELPTATRSVVLVISPSAVCLIGMLTLELLALPRLGWHLHLESPHLPKLALVLMGEVVYCLPIVLIPLSTASILGAVLMTNTAELPLLAMTVFLLAFSSMLRLRDRRDIVTELGILLPAMLVAGYNWTRGSHSQIERPMVFVALLCVVVQMAWLILGHENIRIWLLKKVEQAFDKVAFGG